MPLKPPHHSPRPSKISPLFTTVKQTASACGRRRQIQKHEQPFRALQIAHPLKVQLACSTISLRIHAEN